MRRAIRLRVLRHATIDRFCDANIQLHPKPIVKRLNALTNCPRLSAYMAAINNAALSIHRLKILLQYPRPSRCRLHRLEPC
ncbi:MAG: hypothetical protein GXP24_03415 [Planctomycetes bacterium]|nr:hypothetical protein [Planctomycetota bacterium]